jgi:hypothetical protein
VVLLGAAPLDRCTAIEAGSDVGEMGVVSLRRSLAALALTMDLDDPRDDPRGHHDASEHPRHDQVARFPEHNGKADHAG